MHVWSSVTMAIHKQHTMLQPWIWHNNSNGYLRIETEVCYTCSWAGANWRCTCTTPNPSPREEKFDERWKMHGKCMENTPARPQGSASPSKINVAHYSDLYRTKCSISTRIYIKNTGYVFLIYMHHADTGRTFPYI